MQKRLTILTLAALCVTALGANWMAIRPYAWRASGGYPDAPWLFTVDTTGFIDPVVTAAGLADGDVTWTRPDMTTFTGKAPASASFTVTGEYSLSLTDWEEMTQFNFSGDAISGDISGWTLPSSLVRLYLHTTSVDYGTGNALDGLTAKIVNVRLYGCAWSTAEVDRALADCVDSGLSNKAINVSGTNAAPTSVGDPSSYWTLVEDRGWTVTVTAP